MRPGAPITVAVVSWNNRELLCACLSSLEEDARAGRADVWVVDNASSDGSVAAARERFPWATVVESAENLGYGRAVNLVAERTSGDWLVAANDDVAVEPGALERLLATAERDPRAGAVAPRLVSPDGSTQHSVHSFPTVRLTALLNLGVHRLSRRAGDRLLIEGFWDADRRRAVDWALGAFLLLRRTAFDEAGGFDDRQWMYAEDVDLGWRLRRCGWRTVYEPEARVRHEGSVATTRAFGDQRHDRWMAATYAWMATRRGMPATWAYAAIGVAGAGVRAAAFGALAPLLPRFARPRAANARWMRMHARGLRGRRALVR